MSEKPVFRSLFVVLLLVLGATTAFGAGTTALEFLKVDLGARQAAMGGAATALYDDIYALRYNPAGLINLCGNMEAALTYHSWVADISQTYFGFSLPAGGGKIAFGLNYFNEGEIEERSGDTGLLTDNTFNSYQMEVAIGYGLVFSPSLSAGIAAKLINASYADEKSSTFAGDFGLMYRVNALSLGVAIRNVGGQITIGSRDENLPMVIAAGAGYKVMDDGENSLLFTADVESPQDAELKMSVGAEYTLLDMLAFRGGYIIGDEWETYTLGAGFILNGLSVDYAFVPNTDLETSHRISVSAKFGSAAPPVEAKEEPEDLYYLPVETPPTEEAWTKVQEIDARQPAIEVQQVPAGLLVTMMINFDFDKAEVRPDDYGILQDIADILYTYGNAKVQLLGHTDNIGTDEYNRDLSLRRVEATQKYLVQFAGIHPERFLQPVGYGESRPIDTNTTPEGRFRNRRCEMVIYTSNDAPADGFTFDNYDPTGGAKPAGQPMAQYEGAVVGEMATYPQDGEYVIEIPTSGNYTVRDFVLEDPPRIVVDFTGIQLDLSKKIYPIGVGNIDKVRIGHHEAEGYTRVVVDLKKASNYSVIKDYNLVKIIIKQ